MISKTMISNPSWARLGCGAARREVTGCRGEGGQSGEKGRGGGGGEGSAGIGHRGANARRLEHRQSATQPDGAASLPSRPQASTQ